MCFVTTRSLSLLEISIWQKSPQSVLKWAGIFHLYREKIKYRHYHIYGCFLEKQDILSHAASPTND